MWPFRKKQREQGSPPEDSSLEERLIAERFRAVISGEHTVIAARRAKHSRNPVEPAVPKLDERGELPLFDTAGVALSGGGIRSAAFCLGALQSLAARDLIGQIDYLSTVSGGGYTGAAVSAAMSQPPSAGGTFQEFPFAAPKEFRDKPAVGHLRDFSNYILPRGGSSFVDAIAVVLRGLSVNAFFVVAATIILVSGTLVAFPNMESLNTGSFLSRYADGWIGHPLVNPLVGPYPFALTGWVAAILGVYLVFWALRRSISGAQGTDVRGPWIKTARYIIVVLIGVAVLDVQPLAIAKFHDLIVESNAKGIAEVFASVSAPFAAIVAFFSDKLAGILKTTAQRQDLSALFKRILAEALVLLAAAVLPLLLWLLYLAATLKAMDILDNPVKCPGPLGICWPIVIPLTGWQMSETWALFWTGIVLWTVALGFGANANSLHQLYRDKLSKAFLFDPHWREKSGPDMDDLVPLDARKLTDVSPDTGGPYHLINAAINLQGSKFANRRGRNATFFLFSPKYVGSAVTGYVDTGLMEDDDGHLNLATAMAISGAAVSSNMGSASIRPLTPTLTLLNVRLGYWMRNPYFVERRDTLGRLASRTVSYAANLAPAVVGGRLLKAAKLSSNLSALMEHNNAETLGQIFAPAWNQLRESLGRRLSKFFGFYLFLEMFGGLDETKQDIYLTDGGHIENLGLYQLLARRCRAIIVVDGEADPELSFNALSIVQRYARIDLGIRIDIPWQDIARVSNAVTKAAEAGEPITMSNGPHCAVGSIHYSDGSDGLLLYVKASMTGDEADYVVNYKRRNPSFPHESTGDQFFSEEQFEVYRALGFHATDGFFGGGQSFAWNRSGPWPGGPFSTEDEVRFAFRQAMGLAG